MSRTLAGKYVGVLGLGRSGMAAARLALARGARVYASDAGDALSARETAERLRALGADAQTGGHDPAKLSRCDFIVLSPGIPPTTPVLRAPEIAGVPVVAEVEFASGELDSVVVAITGTNGKTTTTALISHLLTGAGKDAPAGGNIGTALSELALRDPQPEIAVVEVSSFQLAGTRAFAPRIGVLTNLAPDHLDWYADVEDYYADKARLFRNATADSAWVLNAEDTRARALIGDAPGRRYYFRIASQPPADEPGGFLAPNGVLTLRLEPGSEEALVRAEELRILGPHNVANALAASVAARLAGADAESVRRGLRSFRAPPHRLEPVEERGGVLWINDSKATNIASTRVAVRSMARPFILLLGGRHKGEPYTELLPDLGHRLRVVVAYGEAGEIVERDLSGHVPVERVQGSFEEVVARAAEIARPGDAVLLSPACSSFDMFRNYEERGKRFVELVTQGIHANTRA
ncbi:MAG TPA: UDP-N-acetylmuramoyl-L-alanine--D-glutamate ligase [Longimicrobiaceae bacterium]|nr:UDP-N-acetylmuramoyl-L-alanine--D-glutamate ligase [Longimicrobiaceae bacterium]